MGKAKPYVVALIGASATELDAASIESAISAANARLPDYAQVRHWVRAPQRFTHANGLLTANGRLRRREIIARHGTLLAASYATALAS